jgi:hypothetical protein
VEAEQWDTLQLTDETDISSAVKVPRRCSLFLLVKVDWREESGEGRALRNGTRSEAKRSSTKCIYITFKDSVRTSKKTRVSATKNISLMLFCEIVAAFLRITRTHKELTLFGEEC